MAAQELAIRHPERVDGLVLACTDTGWPFGYPMPAASVWLLAATARSAGPRRHRRRHTENRPVRPARTGRNSCAACWRCRVPGRRTARSGRPRRWPVRGTPAVSRPRIRARTLVLHGGADAVVDPRNGRPARGAHPGGTAGDLPRAWPPALLGGPGRFRRGGGVIPARPASRIVISVAVREVPDDGFVLGQARGGDRRRTPAMGRELVRQLAAQGCSVRGLRPERGRRGGDRRPRAAGQDAPPAVRVSGHACDVAEEAQVLRSATSCWPSTTAIMSTWSSAMPASAAAAASSTTAGGLGAHVRGWTGGVLTTAPGPSAAADRQRRRVLVNTSSVNGFWRRWVRACRHRLLHGQVRGQGFHRGAHRGPAHQRAPGAGGGGVCPGTWAWRRRTPVTARGKPRCGGRRPADTVTACSVLA